MERKIPDNAGSLKEEKTMLCDGTQGGALQDVDASIASVFCRREESARNVRFLMGQIDLLTEGYRQLLDSFYWHAGDQIVRAAKAVLRKKEGQPTQRFTDSLRRYDAWKQEYAERERRRVPESAIHSRDETTPKDEPAFKRGVYNTLVREVNECETDLRHLVRLFDEMTARGMSLRQSTRWQVGARVIGRMMKLSCRAVPLPVERRIDQLAQDFRQWTKTLDLESVLSAGSSIMRVSEQQVPPHARVRPRLDLGKIRITQFTPPISRNPFYSMIPGELRLRKWNYDICADRQAVEKRVVAKEFETEIIHFHQLDPLYHSVARNADETRLRAEDLLGFLSNLKAHGARLVLTAHNPLPHDRAFHEIDRNVQKRTFDMMDAVIVLGETAAGELRKQMDQDRLHVIPHPSYAGYYGNAVPRAEARQRLGLDPDRFIFGNLGEIKPYKGLEFIVQAFRQFKETSGDKMSLLLFCGNPGSEEYVSRLKAHATEEVIVHARHIPDDEISVWLGAMDAAVFAFENIWVSGSVVLAMSYLVPPIVPAAGCMEEYVIEQDTGFTYRHKDLAGLAGAMRRATESPLLPHIRYMCNVFNRKNSLATVATTLENVYAHVATL